MIENVEGGSDRVMGAPSTYMDRSLVLTMAATMNAPFPVPSTFTPLSNKRVRNTNVPVLKYSPVPVKKMNNKDDDDFQGGCPIIEENSAS